MPDFRVEWQDNATIAHAFGPTYTLRPSLLPAHSPKFVNSSSAQILSEHRSLPVLRLKRGEERRIAAGHMWVFSNEVDNAATPLAAFTTWCAAREIQSDRDQFLGFAYVNPHALICARIIGRDPAHPLRLVL